MINNGVPPAPRRISISKGRPIKSSPVGQHPVISRSGMTGWCVSPLVRGPTIVIGKAGGGVFWFPDGCWPDDTTSYVNNFAGHDPRYVYHAIRHAIRCAGPSSATMSSAAISSLLEATLTVEAAAQRAAANALDTLETEVSLIDRTSSAIEEVVRRTYHAWFVSLVPSTSRSAGASVPWMCGKALDLFAPIDGSGVPGGWSVGSVNDILELVRPQLPKEEWRLPGPGLLPVIRITDLRAGVSRATKYASPPSNERNIILFGDILFAHGGQPETSVFTKVWEGDTACGHPHVWKIVPRDDYPRSFVLCSMHHIQPTMIQLARNNQTTNVGHVTVPSLLDTKVMIPDSRVLSTWTDVAEPLFRQNLILLRKRKLLIEMISNTSAAVMGTPTKEGDNDEAEHG